jgi:hypothetical protein
MHAPDLSQEDRHRLQSPLVNDAPCLVLNGTANSTFQWCQLSAVSVRHKRRKHGDQTVAVLTGSRALVVRIGRQAARTRRVLVPNGAKETSSIRVPWLGGGRGFAVPSGAYTRVPPTLCESHEMPAKR